MKPRIRRASCTVVAALAICASPRLLSQSSPAYTVTDLGTNEAVETEPFSINDSGQVVGRVLIVFPRFGSRYDPFLWENGLMTVLGTNLPWGSFSQATSINDAGQIVGEIATVESPTVRSPHAFLFENGVMTDLGTLGGTSSIARSINAFGEVVGFAGTRDRGLQGFLWRNGVMTELDTGGLGRILAYDLNTSGEVVGAGGVTGNAVLWRNGVLTDLGTLGGPYSGAMAINSSGQVVGYSYTSAGGSNAVLWQNGTMTDLGAFKGLYTLAYDINDRGQIVGSASIEGEGENASALLWQNGVMTDLNTLLPPLSGWHLREATAINNCGHIVGAGVLNGQRRAFLLTPSDAAQRCQRPANPSPDGTEVPPATQVIDATGVVWTLGLSSETLRNGTHAGGGYARSLLWSGGVLYAFAYDDQWWAWNGSSWNVYGRSRPGTAPVNPSLEGTEVPPASDIIDASGAIWTLGAGGETLRNGIHAGGGYARSLLWTGGTLYARAADDVWWQWTGTAWTV